MGVVAASGEALADRVIAPLKCRVDGRGGLHVEAAPVRMHRLAGRRAQRTLRICARRSGGGPCRTLVLHKFALECAGGQADWHDIVARLVVDRVKELRLRRNKLSFRLRSASLASLNVLCDMDGRRSISRSEADRHWQLDSSCNDTGYVPRHRVELPAGYAPLREIGGRMLIDVVRAGLASPPAPNRKPWPNAMHVTAGVTSGPADATQRTPGPQTDQPARPTPVAAPGVAPFAAPPVRTTSPVGVAMPRPHAGPAPDARVVPQDLGVLTDHVTSGGGQPTSIPPRSWQNGQHVVRVAPVPASANAARPNDGAAVTEPKPAAAVPSGAPTPDPVRVATNPAPQPQNAGLNPLAAVTGITPSATTAGATPVTLNSWDTLVEVIKAGTGDGSSGEERRNAQQSIIAMLLSVGLLTSLLASGLGLFAGRQLWGTPDVSKIDPFQVALRNEVADLTRPDAQMCGELCRSAQGLVVQINEGASGLNGVAPLRRVLLREVRNMEKFLAATMKEQPVNTPEWRRTRYRLQRVVTDLLRLKDITEGARRSLTTAVIAKDLPRDKYEAFEVLGANADASDAVLKRLVDALRATWHPDHAVNEDDRLVREDRIKQINVAWDLIQDKRVEA